MSKKEIWLAALGVLLFGGVVVAAIYGGGGQSALSGSESLGRLELEEANFDFGEISIGGGNVQHSFEVKNVGTEPVVITKVYTSCMCTTAMIKTASDSFGPYGMPGHSLSAAAVVIAAGETAQIEAVFDPAAHGPSGVGLADRTVYLETNAKESAKVEMNFRALVVNR